MGDRTWVRLRLPLSMRAQAEAIIDSPNDTDEFEGEDKKGLKFDYVEFAYEEVNYGQLDFLNNLREAGIPYDSEWGSGSEYGGGTEHFRFTPKGEMVLLENYESAENPSLDALLERIDNAQALRNYILAHKESREVLPWDNQVEYGKLYRATKLLTT